MRYVELNPVRAGMCSDPAHYGWSSYRANALGEANSLLTLQPLFATLGSDDASRQSAYRELFNREEAYDFVSPQQLMLDFMADASCENDARAGPSPQARLQERAWFKCFDSRSGKYVTCHSGNVLTPQRKHGGSGIVERRGFLTPIFNAGAAANTTAQG